MTDTTDPRGLGALLKDFVEGSGELVRQEAQLAKLEAGVLVRRVGVGTASIAVGAVLALLGALALLAGLILLAGDQWLHDRYWLAALIVTLLAGGVAAILRLAGDASVSRRNSSSPTRRSRRSRRMRNG